MNAFHALPVRTLPAVGSSVLPVVLASVFLASLAACTRDGASGPTSGKAPQAATATPPATPSSTPAPDTEKQRQQAWMHAIFGDAYAPGEDKALVELDIDGVRQYHHMTLVSASTLPDGRVVAVVNGKQSDQNGTDIAAHSSPGILNVYILRAHDKAWQVAERRENLSSMGSFGSIGSVDWVALGAGKPGFIVTSGGTWQGYSIASSTVFDIGATVRELGNVTRGSDNDGACGPGMECWNIGSTIRFVDAPETGNPPNMLLDFHGQRSQVAMDQDGNPGVRSDTALRQSARYRFDGKTYVLVEGTNPVPGI